MKTDSWNIPSERCAWMEEIHKNPAAKGWLKHVETL
jgi:hypothetical protein